MTITYTDLVTQTTSDRRKSLEEDYFFLCSCHRCTANSGFDKEVCGSAEARSTEAAVIAIHDAISTAHTLQEGLDLYSKALQACNGTLVKPCSHLVDLAELFLMAFFLLLGTCSQHPNLLFPLFIYCDGNRPMAFLSTHMFVQLFARPPPPSLPSFPIPFPPLSFSSTPR